jgi:AGZA family xanthine/uracil permease-like MFS transporter
MWIISLGCIAAITVFLAGVLFILFSFTKLRESLIHSIPNSLKYGITSGIGLFIAFIGLKMSGIVVAVGSTFGTSPSSAYIESSAGVAAGGRTGLTALVVAVLFAVSMFFSPLISAISSLPAITAPVLIIVDCFMMEGLSRIDWKVFDEAFPVFAIILSMPLTSSIATGIAIGFITYPLMKLVGGKGKEVHPILYVFGVIFVIQMVFFPAH